MKVLIQRRELIKFKDKSGNELSKREINKKIVSNFIFEKIKGLDVNIEDPFKWKLVHEFKKGEKISKDFELPDIEKDLRSENEYLKKELESMIGATKNPVDNSTDTTIETKKEERTRYFKDAKELGLSPAKNIKTEDLILMVNEAIQE